MIKEEHRHIQTEYKYGKPTVWAVALCPQFTNHRNVNQIEEVSWTCVSSASSHFISCHVFAANMLIHSSNH